MARINAAYDLLWTEELGLGSGETPIVTSSDGVGLASGSATGWSAIATVPHIFSHQSPGAGSSSAAWPVRAMPLTLHLGPNSRYSDQPFPSGSEMSHRSRSKSHFPPTRNASATD